MKQLTRSAGRLKKVFMLLICMSIMTVPAMSGAGGGIKDDGHYYTKVTNKTDGDAEIELTYGISQSDLKYKIAKGSSYTFDSAKRCAFALSCIDGTHGRIILCIAGGRTVQSTTDCLSPACFSTDWAFKKRSDGSYYFDRD